MKKRKAGTRPKPRMQLFAEHMRRDSNRLASQAAVAETKAMLAEAMWKNGATIESLAEKLGREPIEIQEVFAAEDIDIRTLSDLLTGLNREARFELTPKTRTVATA